MLTQSKWRSIGAIAIVATVVLAACGDDDDSTDAPPASDESSADAATVATSSADTSVTASSTVGADTTGSSGGDGSQGEQSGPADDSLEPVRLGFVTMTQGDITYPDTVAGFEGAVAYANAELGGVEGHPIEVVGCDVGVDEESNQKCGQEFANDGDLTAVVTGLLFNAGPLYGAVSGSGVPVLGGVPLTNADYTAPNTVFYSPGSVVNRAVAKYVRDFHPEWKRFGILITEGDAGALTEEFVREILEPAGVEVVSAVVPSSTGDLTPLINSLGDVDGYFPGLSTAQCTQVALALETIAPDVPVVTVGACVNSQVWAQAPGSQEGWEVVTGDRSFEMGEGVSDDLDVFIEKFPEYGNEDDQGRFSTVSWGSALTLRSVLNSIGFDNLTPESITDALAAFTGPVNMGVDTVVCPGEIYPTVCAADARAYEVAGEQMVPIPEAGQISIVGD